MESHPTDPPVTTVAFRLKKREKKALQAQAKAEGITVSVLLYRLVFDAPDMVRKVGPKPKEKPPADHDTVTTPTTSPDQ